MAGMASHPWTDFIIYSSLYWLLSVGCCASLCMLYLLAQPFQTMTSLCSKGDIQVPFLIGMKMFLGPLNIALPL